jgi:hypothetical protein
LPQSYLATVGHQSFSTFAHVRGVLDTCHGSCKSFRGSFGAAVNCIVV